MKKLILLSLLLVGCDRETVENTNNWILPEGLKDCKVYYMSSSSGGYMTVMRCPNSTTSVTYPQGKTKATSVTTEETVQETKFKVGDCFKVDFSTEFNKVILLHKVIEVGKTEYLTQNGFDNGEGEPSGRLITSGINIPGNDREGIRITCPKRFR